MQFLIHVDYFAKYMMENKLKKNEIYILSRSKAEGEGVFYNKYKVACARNLQAEM